MRYPDTFSAINSAPFLSVHGVVFDILFLRRALRAEEAPLEIGLRLLGAPAVACDRPPQAFATACENTTSISVPERAPVLIWKRARLASTSALVSDRLTPVPSDA